LLATISADLQALKDERDKLQGAMSSLDQRLSAAKTEAEKERLLAEKDALQAELDANLDKTTKKKKQRGGGGKKSSGGGDDGGASPAEAKPSGRKNKINLGDGNDPLSGL
jgi:hypothetical protein